jgi:hypothetical protein
MASQQRIAAIDFWRGVVLIVIMIDHVPGNALEALTPRNFGLSDSAEAFVFLSGVSVGAAYFQKLSRDGLGAIWRGCLKRAFYIYRVHLALTFAAVAIFGLAYWLSGFGPLIEVHGRGSIFHEPLQSIPGVLFLTHQLGYFNILPLYVVLMLASPLVLGLARSNLSLALAASIGCYALTKFAGVTLPTWPQPGEWFLDPFAWQLIFTLGLACHILWRGKSPPRSAWILTASAVVVALGSLVVTDAAGAYPGLRDAAFSLLDVGKQRLGLARLVYFLALAYCISQTPFLARLAGGAAGARVSRLGRHSLEIFALSSLLGALGQAILPVAGISNTNEVVEAIGILYTLASIGGLFLLARFLEWRDPISGGSARVFFRVMHGLSHSA